MLIFNIIVYFIAFAGIWIGAGIAIKSVERLARNLHLSSFAVSFIILGFFTSIGELSVGLNSIIQDDPEIYVGNLIGATIVIFMMIIPLLAITGNKIQVSKEIKGFNLVMALIVISAPVLLSIDGQVNRTDGIIAVSLFVILLLCIQTKQNLLERVKNFANVSHARAGRDLAKILLGLVVIFISSHFVVNQTLYFSELLNLSPFLISLLVISVGTNIPELSFVIRSMFMRSNQVAFGNYLGSSSFNTFLFGFLSLLYGKPVALTNSYLVSLSFLIVGLIAFYLFARTKNSISRFEGIALFSLYLLFLATEIFLH